MEEMFHAEGGDHYERTYQQRKSICVIKEI